MGKAYKQQPLLPQRSKSGFDIAMQEIIND